MKKLIKFISLVSLVSYSHSIHAKDEAKDPFSVIENIKLDNGMNIYLAPSEETNLTSIRVDVGIGWNAEDKTKWGVSHLLEHVLFRDKQLKDEMSYLQIIKEAGGSANGSTSKDETSYYGSIPSNKAQWLLETVSKMIISPNMTEKNVEKEKGTVELEIGRPGPITQTLGFNPLDYAWPKYLRTPSFNKAEFGISSEEKFTDTEEQLSNQKLTLEKIKKHYENYYYPANMKLTIAGKFNKKEILKIVNSTWGQLKPRQGLSMPPAERPVPRLAPYVKLNVIDDNNSITYGTKAWGYSEQEKQVLSSYMNYLSHRLMKELRNKKAQTYSAWSDNQLGTDFGYITVNLRTPAENFNENLKYVKKSILNQATNGGLNSEEIQEAKDLYLSHYILKGKEAEAMMGFAKTYQEITKKEGHFTSPFTTLRSISPEQYNSILKKYFRPDYSYENHYKSPLMFAYDYYLLMVASLILTFTGLKRVLTKEFKHDHIRWVRKVKFLPLKGLEIIALIAGWYLFAHGIVLLDKILENIDFLNHSFILTNYLAPGIWFALLMTTFQFTLSALPHKLMVMDDYLVIKSISYYSRKIKLNEIESVETCRTLTYPFPVSKWIFKVGLRYHFYNLKFWQPGLMINMKNGKSHFFSMVNAKDSKIELEKFLIKETELISENKAA